MTDENALIKIEALSTRLDGIIACVSANTRRIDRAEDNVVSLMKQVGIMETILEGNVKVQEKLSTLIEGFEKTLADFRLTLVEIKGNLQIQNREIVSLSDKLKVVESDTENLEERGQFDFVRYVKNNFLTIVFGIGSVWAIVQSIISVLQNK